MYLLLHRENRVCRGIAGIPCSSATAFQLQLSKAEAGAPVSAGGAGGLPRLRWPEVESGFTGSCTGVCVGWCLVVSMRRCRRRVSSRMQRQLRALRQDGEWIELEIPSALVDGKLRSMVEGARGASPADVLSTTTSTRLRVSIAARFKAF